MAVPRVTGYPGYEYGRPGSPGNAHIPMLFSGKLLERFYSKSVIANIATTDYVGELRNVGDTVVIRTLPDVTIKNYEKGKALEIEYPESPAIEFTVKRAKYFNFALDDIDIKQADLSWIDKLADNAAQQQKIVIDSEVFSTIYTKAHPANQGTTAGVRSRAYNLGTAGTPVSLTPANVLDYLIDCDSVLDEQDVPDEDRWIVLPPLIMNLINKSDLKNAAFAGDGKSLLLKGGFTGKQIGKLNIFESNLLYRSTTDGAYYIPFGYKGSLVFVSQINKTERYRPHNTFADAMKGLIVYDFDVIMPAGFGVLYAKKAT
jgi:hypothetical protein